MWKFKYDSIYKIRGCYVLFVEVEAKYDWVINYIVNVSLFIDKNIVWRERYKKMFSKLRKLKDVVFCMCFVV